MRPALVIDGNTRPADVLEDVLERTLEDPAHNDPPARRDFLVVLERQLLERSASLPKHLSDRLCTHGVETIEVTFDADGCAVREDDEPDPSDDLDRHTLVYVSMGDTYASTFLYDESTQTYFVGAWGDWIENRDKLLDIEPRPDESADVVRSPSPSIS